MKHYFSQSNQGLPAPASPLIREGLAGREQAGFAMLFTVLLVSLILSIAISISNLTLKQAVLSNLAKDSGIAFYQADAGVECGMFQDAGLGNFPIGTTYNSGTSTDAIASFQCGDQTMVLDPEVVPTTDFFQYKISGANPAKPCFSIIFDKTHVYDTPSYSMVKSSGSNVCASSPRKVERALQVTY